MITIRLTADDLNNLRFAFSPLRELTASLWAMMNPALYTVHLPWINEASSALAGLELPYLQAMVTPDGQFADFITPRAFTPRPSFEAELVTLSQTPPAEVIRDVRYAPHPHYCRAAFFGLSSGGTGNPR